MNVRNFRFLVNEGRENVRFFFVSKENDFWKMRRHGNKNQKQKEVFVCKRKRKKMKKNNNNKRNRGSEI